MLKKQTFYSDAELNTFFEENAINGVSSVYLVKLIIMYNPATKLLEQHLIYSYKPEMAGGMHMRRGTQK